MFVALAKEPADPDPGRGQSAYQPVRLRCATCRRRWDKALGGFATNNVNMVEIGKLYAGRWRQCAILYDFPPSHPAKEREQCHSELGFFTHKVNVLGVYPADKETQQLEALCKGEQLHGDGIHLRQR